MSVDIERLRERAQSVADGHWSKSDWVDAREVIELLDRLEAAERGRDVLARIGKQIATQDNRITDQPIFVVFEKREYVAAEGYGHERVVWVDEDGDEADAATTEALEQSALDDPCEVTVDGETWRRLATAEHEVFVTACFTEQGCKDYLEINGHNLRKPFIYAAGSFRNTEYQTLRNLMLDAAKEPTDD